MKFTTVHLQHHHIVKAHSRAMTSHTLAWTYSQTTFESRFQRILEAEIINLAPYVIKLPNDWQYYHASR